MSIFLKIILKMLVILILMNFKSKSFKINNLILKLFLKSFYLKHFFNYFHKFKLFLKYIYLFFI